MKAPQQRVDRSYQRLSSKVLCRMLTANDDDTIAAEESIFGLLVEDDGQKNNNCGKSVVVSFASEVYLSLPI